MDAVEARKTIASMVLEAQRLISKILEFHGANAPVDDSKVMPVTTSSIVPPKLIFTPSNDSTKDETFALFPIDQHNNSRKRSREFKAKDSLTPEQLEAKRAADRLRQQKYRIKLKQRMTPEAYAKKLESDRRRKQESRKRLKLKQHDNQQHSSFEEGEEDEDSSSSTGEDMSSDTTSEATDSIPSNNSNISIAAEES